MISGNTIAVCYEPRVYKKEELLTTIYTFIPTTYTASTSECITKHFVLNKVTVSLFDFALIPQEAMMTP